MLTIATLASLHYNIFKNKGNISCFSKQLLQLATMAKISSDERILSCVIKV